MKAVHIGVETQSLFLRRSKTSALRNAHGIGDGNCKLGVVSSYFSGQNPRHVQYMFFKLDLNSLLRGRAGGFVYKKLFISHMICENSSSL